MNALIYTVHLMNNKQKEDTVTLEILQTIENNRDLTPSEYLLANNAPGNSNLAWN